MYDLNTIWTGIAQNTLPGLLETYVYMCLNVRLLQHIKIPVKSSVIH